MIPLSVLDLAPVVQGGTARDALAGSLALARHVERLGYRRYWLAEHHNMPGIASSATAVLLAHVGAGTRRIRIGSGGIMLPNHAPLLIAEQFGTLESLYPGRVDLGLGRAPGTDPLTLRALRRGIESAQRFPEDVLELLHYLGPDQPHAAVRAVPGAGTGVPVWILGSSLFGAQLAASLGLPYAFAAHFAPALVLEALQAYRSRFEPSEYLAEPHAMVCVNAFAAASDEQAQVLASSVQQAFLNLRRGMPSQLPPPVAGFREGLSPQERAVLDEVLRYSAVGSPETVARELSRLGAETRADELMIACMAFDPEARLRSYAIVAEQWGLPSGSPPPLA